MLKCDTNRRKKKCIDFPPSRMSEFLYHVHNIHTYNEGLDRKPEEYKAEHNSKYPFYCLPNCITKTEALNTEMNSKLELKPDFV